MSVTTRCLGKGPKRRYLGSRYASPTVPKPIVGDPNPCHQQQTGQSFKVKGDAEYEGPAEERVTVVDDAVGAGEAAADGMLLTVSYTGTLEGTGAEFDSAKVRHVWHACRGQVMRFTGFAAPPPPSLPFESFRFL